MVIDKNNIFSNLFVNRRAIIETNGYDEFHGNIIDN